MMYPFGYRRPYKNYYNYCYPPPANIPKDFGIPFTNKIEEHNEKQNFFEILGFKLYYDDLIIIGLIFMLFNEGINDQLLIISLILLIGD